MGFDYGNMMKQAKIMQKKMEEIQEELKEMKFEASSGGGVVKVIANGDQEILEVKINKEMVDMNDLDILEDMIIVASNDAIKQSKEEAKNRIAGLTGGLNIPGF
jgi:DNA-binding YbaB/EbfC family protein